MKPAFIVTVHQSDEFRPDGHQYLQRYLDSLEASMQIPYDVFIMENASETKFNAPAYAFYHYLPNQDGGMTRAWNLGVILAVLNGNDIFVVTNEDLIFNESINNLFVDIDTHDYKDISVYGPVCDNPTTWPNQFATNIQPGFKDVTWKEHPVHGWCTVFTSQYWEKFNINGNMFDPTKIWRGQEFFQRRDWQLGAKSFIVLSCLIHHEHTGSWKKTIKTIIQE
jgi:hypothetical protein